ncbi:VOC family protein [Alphaproteobacteria bacterium]|nr:VOC family protein [Alphaproteobacteria bacterium]
MKKIIHHTALTVKNIDLATEFYVNQLNCKLREDTSEANFAVINFYGSQLVLIEDPNKNINKNINIGEEEPSEHFGIILDWDEWHDLKDNLIKKKFEFMVKPNIKTHSKIGKVGNLFVTDPSNNCIEFKSYQNSNMII